MSRRESMPPLYRGRPLARRRHLLEGARKIIRENPEEIEIHCFGIQPHEFQVWKRRAGSDWFEQAEVKNQ